MLHDEIDFAAEENLPAFGETSFEDLFLSTAFELLTNRT
ncbi:putative conjugative element protein [Streptococcus pneumoniae]|nr:Uncharacterised protein [Streptococcus pneumoniae]CIT20002.1 Uncharacterised protein [Streptococcus pneumoniae]CIT83716.1 Uncharacterised protein [Streptococcus pneumoniae]CIZ32986.1 Uncharacterised protein [Streptococcus pneumoniae]CJJ82766.1 Uncharacterised protein [Streptococcus pneumoniae]